MSEGTWEKLSQVAVKGAEYDSRERQPHPKCLKGTRVDLLDYIYRLLDNKEKSRFIWLHGTAGVGKSAVAFTVAERMRGLKMTEETKIEKRLAGTFFFSRKHTKRRTTGYFFATLAYQLATNFPSVRKDVNRAILDNPALLDPDKSLRDQMEAFFLQPLRKLQSRLRECPPLTFVIDALDECTPESLESESLDESTSESELTDLISLLGEALCKPDLPVTHILLTSRSEEHIHKAMQTEEMCPLVCEIPVKTSGQGVAATISLDGADVDNDIYVFLQHSFKELGSRHPDFPQPSRDQLVRLASRAGRRFIVASTMMKFIDDRYHDPRSRLQLMLDLTSELLPGTEVYKLYDRILSTCADPTRAYLHLSIVSALADPLPISQISKLLGPGQGRDVEIVLVQLRSVIDVPTDSSLPVNIYHSSVRDYVSHRSNCSLRQVQYITSPHSLLALNSLYLIVHDIPQSTALLDALSALKRQSQAMQPHDPQNLTHSLSFLVQPPEPVHVLTTLLWLRGKRSPELQFWLETMDGCAWLQTDSVEDWLQTEGGRGWLQTPVGQMWLKTPVGQMWLKTQDGRKWLWAEGGREWLRKNGGKDWLQTEGGQYWLKESGGRIWLETQDGRDWLQTQCGRKWLQIHGTRDWLKTQGGQSWLQSQGEQQWLQTLNVPQLSSLPPPQQYLPLSMQSYSPPSPQPYLPPFQPSLPLFLQRTGLAEEIGLASVGTDPDGRVWLKTKGRQEWLKTRGGREWLKTKGGRAWLKTEAGQEWLQTEAGREWLQTSDGQAWRLTTIWVILEEFSSTLEAVTEYPIVPELPLQPAFRVIHQFKSLPDFLMFPAFLALRHQDHSPAALAQGHLPPDVEIIHHAIQAFSSFAYEAREQSRPTSDALRYACQNWALHLSRAPNPWAETLTHIFKSFWNHNLLSWLERQWCLKDLRSCLTILSEGEKHAKEHCRTTGSSQ